MIDVQDISSEVFEESADSFDDKILDDEILAFWSTIYRYKLSWDPLLNFFVKFGTKIYCIFGIHEFQMQKNTINQTLS